MLPYKVLRSDPNFLKAPNDDHKKEQQGCNGLSGRMHGNSLLGRNIWCTHRKASRQTAQANQTAVEETDLATIRNQEREVNVPLCRHIVRCYKSLEIHDITLNTQKDMDTLPFMDGN